MITGTRSWSAFQSVGSNTSGTRVRISALRPTVEMEVSGPIFLIGLGPHPTPVLFPLFSLRIPRALSHRKAPSPQASPKQLSQPQASEPSPILTGQWSTISSPHLTQTSCVPALPSCDRVLCSGTPSMPGKFVFPVPTKVSFVYPVVTHRY